MTTLNIPKDLPYKNFDIYCQITMHIIIVLYHAHIYIVITRYYAAIRFAKYPRVHLARRGATAS